MKLERPVDTLLPGEIVRWLKQASTFTRVHGEAHFQFFTKARKAHGLDNEGIEHWRAFNEMAYVSIDPVHERVQSLWLSATPWIRVRISLPSPLCKLVKCLLLYWSENTMAETISPERLSVLKS